MNVTIIGAGNMGRGIGTRLVAGGHRVTLVDRTPEKAQELADSLNQGSAGGGSATTGQLDSIQDDIIVLAVGYGTNIQLAKQLGSTINGKLVVDIANPVDFETFALTTKPGISSAEEVAAAAPDARVVKAFNTNFAGTLVEGKVAGVPLDVFIAGDDASAKQTLAGLVQDGGLVAVDVGPLVRSQHLEGLGVLGMSIQQPLELNFMSGWKLLQ